MGVTAKELGIDRLDIKTRMALVEEIWEGIFSEAEQFPITENQRLELDRRIAHHEANPDSGILLEDVMQRVTNRLHK